MNIGIYFKQAWNLIKQEKLFSSIYIIGTGISITLVIVLSIIFYLRVADIYPENNRGRMLIISDADEKHPQGSYGTLGVSYQTMQACFYSLKTAESVTATYTLWGSFHIRPADKKEEIPVTVKYTDTHFWTVFPFRFIEGKPFSQEDFQSGIYTAVISESLAKDIFGTTQVIGNFINMNYKEYRICGVVKDAAPITEYSFAQLWIPYTVIQEYKEGKSNGTVGNLEPYILAPSKKGRKAVIEEVEENLRKYNSTLSEGISISINNNNPPYTHLEAALKHNSKTPVKKTLWKYFFIFSIFLLVPAVSLSGLADSRMERRSSEMGVRRAFGASRKKLMEQIILENFLFTLLGGILGLIFSYLIVIVSSEWLLQLGQNYYNLAPAGVDRIINPSSLINFPVFFTALGVCLLLNLLSAIIPAWKSSHTEIIHSLHNN